MLSWIKTFLNLKFVFYSGLSPSGSGGEGEIGVNVMNKTGHALLTNTPIPSEERNACKVKGAP